MAENLLNAAAGEIPEATPTQSVSTQNKQGEIPTKFKDPQTGELKTEELLKSYLALEKKLGEKSITSGVQGAGTKPASPEEYDIKIKNDLITIDPEMNKQLFALDFTNEQVQAVYDLAVDKVIPLLKDLAADYKSDQEMAALEKAFGGADQFNTLSHQIATWGEKNLDPAIFEVLSTSCDGILTMHKMMNDGVEPSIRGTRETQTADTEESLRSLMKDPKYWKKQDPALVKRVEEGFKRLYK